MYALSTLAALMEEGEVVVQMGVLMGTYNPSSWEETEGPEVQGHPQLSRELWAIPRRCIILGPKRTYRL